MTPDPELMRDRDDELGAWLGTLVDMRPVDADRVLRAITERTRPRRRVPIGLSVLAAAGLAAVVLALSVTSPMTSRPAPPFKLIGDSDAGVVVRIDTTGDQPTAELTVGNTTVSGLELQGTPTDGGVSFDASNPEPFVGAPTVDVPEGSSLLVEGSFDSASASAIEAYGLEPNGQGGVRIAAIKTWQLDSSGGSVVFHGDGDGAPLVVEATIASVPHYFLFLTHVVRA